MAQPKNMQELALQALEFAETLLQEKKELQVKVLTLQEALKISIELLGAALICPSNVNPLKVEKILKMVQEL